jgi:excisionase family DNA binding protein
MELTFELEPHLTKDNVRAVQALTVMEVARALNCHRNTVCVLLNKGDLKGFRLGRSWRVEPRELRIYMERKAA